MALATTLHVRHDVGRYVAPAVVGMEGVLGQDRTGRGLARDCTLHVFLTQTLGCGLHAAEA